MVAVIKIRNDEFFSSKLEPAPLRPWIHQGCGRESKYNRTSAAGHKGQVSEQPSDLDSRDDIYRPRAQSTMASKVVKAVNTDVVP